MALEPVQAGAESGPSAELLDMTRRFWIGLVLSIPVAALEMGGHLTNLHMLLGQRTSNWVQLLLATPVVLWAGWPFFVRGWASIKTRNLNMFTLIAMGPAWRGFTASSARCFQICSLPLCAAVMVQCRFISRPRPSSRCWCSLGRCWSSRRANRQAVPSKRC